jgi:hypothetical protein
MDFELKHNNYRLSKEKLLSEYNFTDVLLIKTKIPPVIDNSVLSSFSDLFPEERLDPLITSLPAPDRVNYASLLGIEDEEVDEDEYKNIEEGGLPADLTPTEMLLTKLLWGEADRFLTILLVAALEDMSIEDVSISLRKMNLF